MKLAEQLKKLVNKTTFIVGNKKNSGKTTFLNSALEYLRPKGKVAYLSIGVDGEANDQIFGFPKPRIMAQVGDIVVTLEAALKHTKAGFKMLKGFPYATVLGRPILVEITSPGLIEIIGPENNAQLAEILKHLRSKLHIETILIDGAINRITQVSSFNDAQFVFICRVDPDRLVSAAGEFERIFKLGKISCHSRCGKRESSGDNRDSRLRGNDKLDASSFIFKGALTHARSEKIPAKVTTVIMEDLTKIFLDNKELERFLRRHKLQFLNGFTLAFVVVNLFGADERSFINHLCDKKLLTKCVVNNIQI